MGKERGKERVEWRGEENRGEGTREGFVQWYPRSTDIDYEPLGHSF